MKSKTMWGESKGDKLQCREVQKKEKYSYNNAKVQKKSLQKENPKEIEFGKAQNNARKA